jgi:hypothetical protein
MKPHLLLSVLCVSLVGLGLFEKYHGTPVLSPTPGAWDQGRWWLYYRR